MDEKSNPHLDGQGNYRCPLDNEQCTVTLEDYPPDGKAITYSCRAHNHFAGQTRTFYGMKRGRAPLWLAKMRARRKWNQIAADGWAEWGNRFST